MAAVLSCGPGALLSHGSAAVLWGLLKSQDGIDVVVPEGTYRRRPGVRVHRRSGLLIKDRRVVQGIPVTDPISTLVDLAAAGPKRRSERAVSEADRLGLVDVETLRAVVDLLPRRPGVGRLRRLLGGKPLTETGLEQRFLAIVRRASLPMPETQIAVNDYRVDFFWPVLGLVVEADGWRYHRTPTAQATDNRRDHAHARDGLTTLRFAEEQICDEPNEVARTLGIVINRLANDGDR